MTKNALLYICRERERERERETTNGYGSPENLDNELESLFKRAVSPNLPPN